MKKIYNIKTLAVAAFALMANVAFGQTTFKLTANGVPVANGDVIDQPYDFEDYSMPEYDFYMYHYEWNPHLEVSTTGGDADLKVTVTSVGDTEGFQICWPGNCNFVASGQSVVVSGKITDVPVDLRIDKVVELYEAGLVPTEGGSIKVKLECGSETMEITVNALLEKSGVGEGILNLTANGVPVEDGEIIDQAYEFEDYSMPEYDFYMYHYEWNPHLEVSTTGGDADLKVTVTSVGDTEGFQICWPGNCNFVASGQSVVVSGKITDVPVDLRIDKVVELYEAGLVPTEGGSIKVKLECGSETMEITVNALLEKSGVGENLVDSNAAPEYYTIQGVRVAEPQKGQLVIERKGAKVTKRIF